jgi:hypothetical protein
VDAQVSNGKGDTPRPLAVDDATFADNWARTFGVRMHVSPAVAAWARREDETFRRALEAWDGERLYPDAREDAQ